MTDPDDAIASTLSAPQHFAAVFDRHVDAIHAYLARRVGREDADDLTGEVFRIAFDRRASFDPGRGEIRPWLYGIAWNLVSTHRRARGRADRAWQRLDRPVPVDDTHRLIERVDAHRTSPAIFEALRELRPGDREVLLLFAVEELSYAEIAAAMQTPVGTVRSRLSRARRQLQAVLALPSDAAPAPTPTLPSLASQPGDPSRG